MASDNRNMDRDTQYRLSREKLKKRLDQDVDGRTEIEAADREEASKEAADRERADRERADRETQNTEMASKSEREAQTQKDRSLPESKHTQDVEKKNIIAPQTIKRVGQDQARRVRFAFDRERGLGWLLSMVGKNKWAILLYLLLGFLLSAFIYVRALPVRYDLKIGDVATLDITSNRDIVNKAETEVRAQNAKSQVQMITKRSETVSAEAVGRVKNFYAQVDSVRLALMNEAKGQNGTGGETVQSSTNSTAPSATDSAENKESTATTANSAQASGKTTA